MPVRLTLPRSFAAVLADADRPHIGMWVCSGSALVAEICAGSGLDWLLIDMEHAPNGLESIVAQLQAVAAYPVTPLVRVPVNDPVVIKQVLDLGAQNVLVPMVSSRAEAEAAVRAVTYPPSGVRGVGSALGRAARWNRVGGYLADAGSLVSVCVQIESVSAVERAAEIAASGVHGILAGPSDLAASMGVLGDQHHPDVVAAVEHCIAVGRRAGVPVGVNAFDPATARRYLDAGASFMLVGADVTVLARGSEALADRFRGPEPAAHDERTRR
ncbi:HpcH/HpaI aldolase family protein [Mangrovihabitans endophyticus]|uniref:2,4-dihydroxyhept-2-ene-1,7-dioic acid aldolase n=1 Tax=Mangrovihabitans endophyticus TaxID=1751298 RepID=A0A8J3FL29_9ACTN|nr:HpcH/HpaI aldolase/citrate lyase family protein [Mangrovihabitans endophyticus]GGK75849.1 2,4-dihydroxyhept-2-ene-1,7-dioic acid aldolase [Mangrovihabitans endophyticus]